MMLNFKRTVIHCRDQAFFETPYGTASSTCHEHLYSSALNLMTWHLNEIPT
jgi:hypothetical protein